MKKLFLAIATHEGLEPTSLQILKKLRINADQKELEVRWSPAANYHVTLVFLGNTDEAKIPDIEAGMAEVAARTPPFTLKIAGVGAFPDEFTSRVLWFGVQNSKHLRFLHENLSENLLQRGYPADARPFVPHITVARLRNPHKTKDMMSPFIRKAIAKITVNEIVLFESVGSFPFPAYKPLKSVMLTGSEPVEDEITE